jgi:hypothetical protein
MGSICEYIAKYCTWPSIVSAPAVFWRFDTDARLSRGRLEDTGDEQAPCHREVFDLSDEELWEAFQGTEITDLEVCDGTGGYRPITEQEFLTIHTEYKAKSKR